jgi:transposase
MGYIKGEERNQFVMFPDCIDEYITEENPVRIIDAFVNGLDLTKLEFTRTNPKAIGHPSYDPKDMLKLFIYGYMNQVRSSRRLEKEASRNVEVMWLLNKLVPDFKTIADFRKDNKEALKGVFREFTMLCKSWDLFGKELVAIDGSKFRASNSKRNNFSSKKLDRSLKYIDEKIAEYLKSLEEGDVLEANEKKLSSEEIKQKIEELKNRKTAYQTYQEKLKESGEDELSTIDPDARLMGANNKATEVGYNVQTAVDGKHKLAVDFEVINSSSDKGQLSEMALRAKKILDVEKLEVLADKGYYNAEELEKCESENITTYVTRQVFANSTGEREFYQDRFKYDAEKDSYICPMGHELNRKINKGTKSEKARYQNYEACSKCHFKDKCTTAEKGRQIVRGEYQDFLDIVDARTAANKEKYKQRQMIVEHPFGTVKRGMNAGYFLTRGFSSVRAEVSLSFLAYNLKRVINILGFKGIMERLAMA